MPGTSFRWTCSGAAKKPSSQIMAAVAPLTHTVTQETFDDDNCGGSPRGSSNFGGDGECFQTTGGFRSENAKCDPDNAAMHVTLYSDTGCGSYLNAFSIPSGQCHKEPNMPGTSFRWTCSGAAKKPSTQIMAAVAPLTHTVTQETFDDDNCGGSPRGSSSFGGDGECFQTNGGFQSENAKCDPDNAAM